MKNLFENITIDNFKVFKNSKIEFAPINILIGKNNSGKSTLMQLMKLIEISNTKSGLSKLHFSELKDLHSFNEFKTIDYNKELITLKISFEVDWFTEFQSQEEDSIIKEGLFFLELQYKKSNLNKLDGLLCSYKIYDNNNEEIYSCTLEISDNREEFSRIDVNYEKIRSWMSMFYDNKIDKLNKLKKFLGSDKTLEELFNNLNNEEATINSYILKKMFNSSTDLEDLVSDESEMDGSDREELAENQLNANNEFNDLMYNDLTPDKYEGYDTKLVNLDSDIAPRHNPNKKVKNQILSKGKFPDSYSLEMFKSIKKYELMYVYDNEDGTELSESQIKSINKIEKVFLRKPYFFKSGINIKFSNLLDGPHIGELISNIKKEGNIRLIFDRCEMSGDETCRLSEYGIFIGNIANTLLNTRSFLNDNISIDISDPDIDKEDITSFLKPIYNNPLADYQNDFVNKWLKEFTYTDDSGYKIIKEGNELKIYFNDERDSIDSYGKGLQELIYLIFNIAKQSKDKESIMLIVEPEAHLHPNFQSLLADMFNSASKLFNIKFIIESHSEYLLRKLQYLTINKDIRKGEDISKFDENGNFKEQHIFGDVIVNYFENNSDTNSTIINQIYIDKFGNLSDELGEGFIDHTPNLMIEMLKLKNKNK